MNVSQFLLNLAYSVVGLRKSLTPTEMEEFTFVNDLDSIKDHDYTEFNAWYSGSSDALLQFFNYNDLITWQKEPFYYKNKRSYYWSVASQEDEIKRTHSGIPRAITDTLVALVGDPTVQGTEERKAVCDELDSDLREMGFWSMYRQEQMPLTFVDGYGAYKIFYDPALSDKPLISYYRADKVRVYRVAGVLIGMTFLDWYTDGKDTYLIAETRCKCGKGYKYFFNCFKTLAQKTDQLQSITPEECPYMVGLKDIDNMPSLFAEPCAFIHDNYYHREGKSIYQGMTDKFDDLDQTLSQFSNTIRRATPIEAFNIDFCARQKNGRPVMPNSFERKYIEIKGGATAFQGGSATVPPVTVTQPQINAEMFRSAYESLLMACIIGFMAPSYVGIEQAAGRQSADSKRESNKTTVLFRNGVCHTESEILNSLFRQYLLAKEYFGHGTYTPDKYKFDVVFDEFSDTSWEVKLDAVSRGVASGVLSPEMAVEKLYGNTLSNEKKASEVQYIKDTVQAQQQTAEMQAMIGPNADDMMALGEEEPVGAEANEMNESALADRAI